MKFFNSHYYCLWICKWLWCSRVHILSPCNPYSQSYGFSSSHVWMWELDHKEGWALKNWCFWTVVLEKTLESPSTIRRYNQSILKEISLEYSLEGLMMKLKLQYFSYLMQRTDSLEKTLMLRKLEGRRRGRQRMRGLGGITELWEMMKVRKVWLAAVHGVSNSWTQLNDWTTTTNLRGKL